MENRHRIVQTSELNSSAKEQLLQLWNNAYPEGISHKNLDAFENYLSALINTKHYLLLGNSDAILGWAFTFVRDNEKWFAIILEESIMGQGIGRLMIEMLKQSEIEAFSQEAGANVAMHGAPGFGIYGVDIFVKTDDAEKAVQLIKEINNQENEENF